MDKKGRKETWWIYAFGITCTNCDVQFMEIGGGKRKKKRENELQIVYYCSKPGFTPFCVGNASLS